MAAVHQAHLPGNYESYDPDSSRSGPALCKLCWEEAGQQNLDLLESVWVSVGGWSLIWWLCQNHVEAVRTRGMESVRFIRKVGGVVRYPTA
jgi:hypothetical protein